MCRNIWLLKSWGFKENVPIWRGPAGHELHRAQSWRPSSPRSCAGSDCSCAVAWEPCMSQQRMHISLGATLGPVLELGSLEAVLYLEMAMQGSERFYYNNTMAIDPQLFISYARHKNSCKISLQRLSKWIIESDYATSWQSVHCQDLLKVQSTRALNMSLYEILAMPLWDMATPNNFVKRYALDVCVTVSNGGILHPPFCLCWVASSNLLKVGQSLLNLPRCDAQRPQRR